MEELPGAVKPPGDRGRGLPRGRCARSARLRRSLRWGRRPHTGSAPWATEAAPARRRRRRLGRCQLTRQRVRSASRPGSESDVDAKSGVESPSRVRVTLLSDSEGRKPGTRAAACQWPRSRCRSTPRPASTGPWGATLPRAQDECARVTVARWQAGYRPPAPKKTGGPTRALPHDRGRAASVRGPCSLPVSSVYDMRAGAAAGLRSHSCAARCH